MSCVLYTNYSSTTALTGSVPFGSTVHRKGRMATLETQGIVVRGGCNDYATVRGTLNAVATDAGEVTLTVMVDNLPDREVTVTAAAGGYIAIPFELALKGCCCGRHVITCTVDAEVTVSSFTVIVESA